MNTATAVVPATTSDRATCRAALLTDPGRWDLVHCDKPQPQSGQVLIALEGCGVCGSNLPVWEGKPWFKYPLEPGAPGHEGWGVIAELGEGVAELRVGQRVAALSYHAFADYDVADATAVVPLPEDSTLPFPAEALGCAMNVFRRAEVSAGQWVAIVGIGFLGALLTQLCVQAGARVVAISRRAFALDVARSAGAPHAITLADHQSVIAAARELTNDRGCETVIECTGEAGPLDLAGELTAIRGRLVIAGYHQDGPRLVNMQLWNWRGLDVINAHERAVAAYTAGMRAAVEAVQTRRLDPRPLFTHSFKLDELAGAFHVMRERPDGFMKALVLT